MLLARSLQWTISVLLAATLSGCVSSSTIVNASPSNSAWASYLEQSPFSYSIGSSPYVTRTLASNIGKIPLDGINPRIADHIRRSKEWAEDYPVFLRRALSARKEAHARAKGYEGMSTDFGQWLGRNSSRGDASDPERWVNGKLGYLFAWWINESYAFSQAEAAAAREMAPLLRRGLALSEEEYQINQSIGLASTNYLLKNTGHY